MRFFGHGPTPTALKRVAMIVLFLAEVARGGDDVHLAVAANFSRTASKLVSDFENELRSKQPSTKPLKIVISVGSTGQLATQILQGAPMDIFLGADEARPLSLVEAQLVDKTHSFIYARGHLVLWSKKNLNADFEQFLKNAQFRHVALANPLHAPYGTAAQNLLQTLGLWAHLQSKIVYGQDIGGTLQLVASGAADAGFVALAQVIPETGIGGHYLMIPKSLAQEIPQRAVMLKRSSHRDEVRKFWNYLQSPSACKIIQLSGYDSACGQL